MRVLFDQGTPVGIRHVLEGHFVRTAHEEGWSTLQNGELLESAEDAGFDVLVTTDTSLPHQQNLTGRKLAVVILSKNRWKLIKSKLAEITAAVTSAKPGTFSVVEIPDLRT
jgi:hypothetical protein